MKFTKTKKSAVANLESLHRVFTVPEKKSSKLFEIEEHLSTNLHGFLKKHIVATDDPLTEIEQDFQNTAIPLDPMFVSDHAEFVLNKVLAQSVHTASPRFIGHMTSAIPYFMLPLSKIMMALNQNLVKAETSKVFTPLERQVVAMLHNLTYANSEDFYKKYIHSPDHALGLFCSGGTIANVSALWVARNKFFSKIDPSLDIANSGLAYCLNKSNLNRLVILVSELGHYSMLKAADLLGIGRANLVKIPTGQNYKVDITKLKDAIAKLKTDGAGILAIVGIAGTTETGHVDPLLDLSNIAEKENIHFHIDAAWGGPTIFSKKYGHLLAGMNRADSITFDPHKQLYVPMGNGIVIFKNPDDIHAVKFHTQYVIREGSKDLGKFTMEGSRPGNALLVHAALNIIGQKGYELLIDMGIEKAKNFADLIRKNPDFELISEPELNILTYRYFPEKIRKNTQLKDSQLNEILNRLNVQLQKQQRERGKSFVSRTVLNPHKYNRQPISVLRVVLANPLTDMSILREILDEQQEIGCGLINSFF